MTRWFDPVQLVATGYRVMRKRDTRDSGPVDTPTFHDHSAADELWFDYAADMGDAFDPTAQVAWMLGRKKLLVGATAARSEELCRGSFLVLGGDEVYPYATVKRYEKQLTKPYAQALEGADPPPRVYAIPGNHDWYGGLTAWRQVLTAAEGSTTTFGGWTVGQQASWWAIKLPHGWWMWGLDTYLDGTINQAQHDYFARVAEKLRPGDQVILCTPVPLWRLREKKPDQLVIIDELVHELIDAADAKARLFLAGDSHVFARYIRRPSATGTLEHHVTSGGAGAFLHPTHNLASAVPQTAMDDGAFVDQAPFLDGRFWPDRHRSREGIVRGALHAVLDRQSVSLGLLVALAYALYGFVAGAAVRDVPPNDGWRGLKDAFRSVVDFGPGVVATVVAAVVLVGAGIAMALPNTKERAVVRFARRAGAVHGVAQVGALAVTAALSHWLIGALAHRSWPPTALPVGLSGVAGAVGAMLVLLVYLSLVNRNHRVNDNEAYSMRHYEDGKHFLRCHIDRLGQLTVHLIGIDRIKPGWAAAMEAGAPLPPKATEGSKVPLGAVEWIETVRTQVDPIAFAGDANRWVALSVSDPDDATKEQVTRLHEVVGAIAEALLAAGCNVAYGGDDRETGYTTTLAKAADRSPDAWVPRVRRYAATPPDPGAGAAGAVELMPPEQSDSTVDTALTAIREKVTEDTIARVVLGGRARGPGMPGVVEEAAISLDHDQPLLVVGGFGGAASLIARVVTGKAVPDDVPAATRHLLGMFRPSTAGPVHLRNGLEPTENNELLTTTELHRIVHLVLQGIRSNVFGPG